MVGQLPPSQERNHIKQRYIAFRTALSETVYLRNALGDDWLLSLEKLVAEYSGHGGFSAPNHLLFLHFGFDLTEERAVDAVRRLDTNYCLVLGSTQKKKSVRAKLLGAGASREDH